MTEDSQTAAPMPQHYQVPTEQELLATLQAARQEGATDNVLARLLAELHRRFDDVEAVSLARFHTNDESASLNSNRIAAVSQNLDTVRAALDTAVAELGARIEALEAAPPALRMTFENVRDLVAAATGGAMVMEQPR